MKRLYRSNRERMMAGVLGGIAEYFKIDPTFVRLLFVLGLILSFGGFFIFYLIAVFIIPLDPEVF